MSKQPLRAEELILLVERQIAEGAWQYGVLYDLRAVAEPSAADAVTFADYVTERAKTLGPRGPVALVTSAPTIVSVVHRYAFESDERGFHTEVFTDPAEAERWLEKAADNAYRRMATAAPVEFCWRVMGLNQRMITCAIYQLDEDRFDVRVWKVDAEIVRGRRTGDIARARELADDWREALIAKGGFREIWRSSHART